MKEENNKCDFCGKFTEVNRQYLHSRNKLSGGDGFKFIRFCNECGLLEEIRIPTHKSVELAKKGDVLVNQYNREIKVEDVTEELIFCYTDYIDVLTAYKKELLKSWGWYLK